MKPQTVSLEVAKQLKEAGWEKHCIFCLKEGYPDVAMTTDESIGSHDLYMPQLHEILEELPYKIIHGTANMFLKVEKFEDDYIVGYYEFSEYPWGEQKNENPHDAAALLWVWCVDNGHISL